jgi:hypothetical protein
MIKFDRKQGIACSVKNVEKISTDYNEKTRVTTKTSRYIFTCKLNEQYLRLVTNDWSSITEGSLITAYGISIFGTSFSAFAIVDNKKDYRVLYSKNNMLQTISGSSLGILFVFLLAILVADNDSWKAHIWLYISFAIVGFSTLLNVYLIDYCVNKLANEFNIRKPVSINFPWWKLPLIISSCIVLITSPFLIIYIFR